MKSSVQLSCTLLTFSVLSIFVKTSSAKQFDRSFPVVCSRKNGCNGAIHVKIPENTSVVDAYAFSNDDNLQVVDIPNTVTIIGPFAFHGCEVLSIVNLPTSISSISIGTFSDCISLKEMVIPMSVTSIEEQAFRGCRALKSVIISNSLISFGNRAFFGCPQLRCISRDGFSCGFDSSVSVGREAFAGCPLLAGSQERLSAIKAVASVVTKRSRTLNQPSDGLICRFGGYCSRDKDCVPGNKCKFTGSFFSQCVEDATSYLPQSSGCIANYGAVCDPQSTCCDPGASCRVVDDTIVTRCAPIEAPSCQQPTAFVALVPTPVISHSEKICRFGGYCIEDGDCMPGNRCGVVNAYFTQCIADPTIFIKPERGCLSDYDRDCSSTDTCCDPGSICRVVDDSSILRCAPVESTGCMNPIAFPLATAVPAIQPAVLSDICQFGGFCRVDSDCVAGNKCHLVNAYYSQCLADASTYLPAYSGCLANYASPCDSRSTCCDPGAFCTAIDGGTAVCQPLKANSCEQPEGYNTRSALERMPLKSICRFGGYCRVDSDCVLGNKCNIVNGYYSQCVEDTTLFLLPSSGCVSNFDSPCNDLSTCCDPGAACSSIDGEQPVCRPLESPDCLQPLGYEDPALAALSQPVALPTSTPSTSPTSWSSPVFDAFTPTASPALDRSSSEQKICQYGSFCAADSDCVAGNMCAIQSGGYYSQCVPDSSQYLVPDSTFSCLANNGPPCSVTGNGTCCDPGAKCRETRYLYFQCVQITAPACAFPTGWKTAPINDVPTSLPTTHSGLWLQPTALPTLDPSHVHALVRICQYGGYCLDDSDCTPGNLCAQYNPYYSQCIADPSSYLPSSSGCVYNYQGKCQSDFDCCDPGAICSTSNPYYRQCMQPSLPPLCLNPVGFSTVSAGKLSSPHSLGKVQTVLSYFPTFDIAIALDKVSADGVCRTILSDPAGPASPLLAAIQHILAGYGFRNLASAKLLSCKETVALNISSSRRRLIPDATVELQTLASLAVSSGMTYSGAFQIIAGLHNSLETAVSDLSFTHNVQAVSVAVQSRVFEPAVVTSVNNLGPLNSTILFNVTLLICQYGFNCRTNADCVLGNKCVLETSVGKNSSSSQCVPDNSQIRTSSCISSSSTASSDNTTPCQSSSDCCDPGAVCDASFRCSQPVAPLCIMPDSALTALSEPPSASPSVVQAISSDFPSAAPVYTPTVLLTDPPSVNPSQTPTTIPTSNPLTTTAPSVASSTSNAPTSVAPSTSTFSSNSPTTTNPSVATSTSTLPTSAAPSTSTSTSNAPTTSNPSVSTSTSTLPTSAAPSTSTSTSNAPTNFPPSAPLTDSPTTVSPSTSSPTTDSPTSAPPSIHSSVPSSSGSTTPSALVSEAPTSTVFSDSPTIIPTSISSTSQPSSKVTEVPTTASLTPAPTAESSGSPNSLLSTSNPVVAPQQLSAQPYSKPSSSPRYKPTKNPLTSSPSDVPTEEPSEEPILQPTAAATNTPTAAGTAPPFVLPSALPLVLPAVTFQSLLALANASSALLGLGDSPTDAHYRAALVATMDSILKIPRGSTTYKQDSNRVRSQNRLLVSSSQAVTVVSRVQTTVSLSTFPTIRDPAGLQQFIALKSFLALSVNNGAFLQEMRHQLSGYADTLPPNAAYVNITSVNMLLLQSDTRSPSTSGTATPTSSTAYSSSQSGSRGNGDNITAVAVSVSLSALVLSLSVIAAVMATRRYMRKQTKIYRAPSIMSSESVAADIGGIGSDDRHIIVGKGGSDDHEDVKMSRFIRPWAALSRDSSAPPGGISRSSFRDGESKKKSWWQMFLPVGENGDDVEVSGIPAQDEGLSRMSSLDSLSHEVRLKSIQSSDFKVYMRSSSEGAENFAAGTGSLGDHGRVEQNLTAAAVDAASSVSALANVNVSVKSSDSADLDLDSEHRTVGADSRDW